jgi:putative restriction endonuclease
VVILVRSSRIDGDVPALCEAKVFFPNRLPSLSTALWGEERFPYVFFFNTERLDLSWIEFVQDIGYADNFNPRGNFYSVADHRLSRFNGPAGYIRHLRQTRVWLPNGESLATLDLKSELPESDQEEIQQTKDELKFLVNQSCDQPPELTDEQGYSNVRRRARSKAFRIGIRKLYRSSCCFCGMSVVSPEGEPEAQSAHIYPKEKGGSDDFRNGICLCRFHHWAFDSGWMSLTDDLQILVRDNLPRGSDYARIGNLEGNKITPPYDRSLRPHALFLSAHRQLHKF